MSERKNIIADSQILNGIQKCAYYFDLYFNKNLRPPVQSEAIEEGDLLHQYMEPYYKGLRENPSIIYEDEAYERLISSAIEYGRNQTIESDLIPEEIVTVTKHFQENVRHFKLDGLKILEVERPFIVELYKDDEYGFYYTGKIDLIADVPNYGPSVIDHKKTARNQTPQSTSNQFTGYSFGSGLQNVFINKVGFQKTLSPEERFRRYHLYYTKDMIERWRRDTIWWYFQLAMFKETNQWPRNRTSCDKYGECMFYQDICSCATDDSLEWAMQAKFIVGEDWDVTKHLKKEKENASKT